MDMPDWFPKALEDARAEDRRNRIAAMPRVKIMFGRDWLHGPDDYAFGIMWDKDPAPEGCADIYRRRFLLHLTFRISLEK